jgi:hypothetical protein
MFNRTLNIFDSLAQLEVCPPLFLDPCGIVLAEC